MRRRTESPVIPASSHAVAVAAGQQVASSWTSTARCGWGNINCCTFAGIRALGGFDDDGAGLLPTSCWDAGIAGKMQGARSAALSNTRNSNGLAKEIGEGQQM